METEKKKKGIKTVAKKIAKNALKIASEAPKPFTIETTFNLGGSTPLALKNEPNRSMLWVLKLNINKILDRSFYKYNARLSINEEPFNRRIEEAERKMEEVRTEAHLPNMEDKGEIKRLEETIKNVKSELAQLIKNTDTIDFFATVMTIKYSGIMTVVEFNIPADTINLLNKNRFFFGQYKIELEPIWDRETDNNA